MSIKVKVLEEKEVAILSVSAGARYWEDAIVNGVEDEDGSLIPCRIGDSWCPEINLATGKILNWTQGVTADIHYKICDNGCYRLKDKDGNVIVSIDGYVPTIMCPNGQGYGDYIKMTVDENGQIAKWSNKDLSDFEEE